MKGKLNLFLALLLLAAVFVSASPAAFAASIDNSIKSSAFEKPVSDGKSYAELEFEKYDKGHEVQHPKNSSYLDTPQLRYINAPKGHSALAYCEPSSKSDKQDDAYHGSYVTVFAYEDGWACISYKNHKLETCVGWVAADNLSPRFPGEDVFFGEPISYDVDEYFMIDPVQSLSKQYFVDSDCKYMEIDLRWPDPETCFAITIYYKVISRNGVSDASGERIVYINDGSGWEEVGYFEVNKDLAPVEITINYDEPRSIKAVAVIPSDADLEKCLVSQSVVYMYFPYE